MPRRQKKADLTGANEKTSRGKSGAKSKKAKKRPIPKAGIDRQFNSGLWTLARMRSFVMSALRRAQWPARHRSFNKAFIRDGINPATGRQCKLHRCEECGGEFPQNQCHADHLHEVIPINHKWASRPGSFLSYDWNEVIRRLYVEADQYRILCHSCHSECTRKENEARKIQQELPL